MSAEAPQTAAPQAPLERVTDESVQSILGDVRDQWESQQPEATPATAPAPEPAPTEPSPAEAPKVEPEAAPPAEAAPEAAPEPSPASLPPTPESRLAPIFDLTSLPADQAIPQAVEIMQGLYQYDPVAYGVLANAVLQASPQSAAKLVLEANGIPQEKVTEFKTWLDRGGDALPEPVEYPPFEKTVQELQSAEGEQWVQLSNGLQVDLKTPDGLDRYENAKFRYDVEVEKKIGERERLVEQQRQADEQKENEARQAQESLISRVNFYEDGRFAVVDEVVDGVVSSLDPSDKFRADMFKVYARDFINSHPEVQKLGHQVSPYVKQGHGFDKGQDGSYKLSGRVAELADAQDRIIRRELNTLRDQFNKDILRTNRAELAATATQPQIPADARTVEATAPTISGLESSNSIQDILAAAREEDRRRAGAGR